MFVWYIWLVTSITLYWDWSQMYTWVGVLLQLLLQEYTTISALIIDFFLHMIVSLLSFIATSFVLIFRYFHLLVFLSDCHSINYKTSSLFIFFHAESLFNAFATAAFFKFVVFSIFEMRYLLAIWKANRPMNNGEGWETMRRELSVLYSRFCK